MESQGLAGRIANAFIASKLTPLIVIASLLMGLFAVVVIPREEDPQIIVPMIDILVTYPGASAQEVEDRVTRPMERFLWEIKGVEYLYSIVKPGMNLTIVRFYVGESMEDSLVNLYTKLMSNYDKIPPGVSEPLVKPKSIDDVPILTLTLWDEEGQYSGYELRRIATELCWELKKDHDIAETTVIGGQKRQLRVVLDPVKLQSYRVSPAQILETLQKANVKLPSGSFPAANREFIVETGGFLKDVGDVGQVLVATAGGKPVYLKDVAEIIDGPEEISNYVFMGTGPAAHDDRYGLYEAVTVAIAKKKGTNATHLAERALQKIDQLRGEILPASLPITITRNYGDTAKEKSDELLYHMAIAAVSVTLLIAFALGWRESLVVGVAVPVTLALTIFFNYLYGYTLNRVTLFALIFSIGILVDDAIVVVENIHRHFRMGRVDIPTAIAAVDEVGNPTILATFTVIAALLPMAFVSGLMGPYMRPIPVGASAAMMLSLLIAFIISPWLSYIVLRGVKHQPDEEKQEEGKFIAKFNHLYESNLRGLLNSGKRRLVALLLIVALMGAAVALVPLKGVALKMLPFDNKSELQVVLDMPEGSALEDTAALAREVGEYLRTVPEVTHFQLYVGTASPFNFNGLVRHYYFRSGSNQADIQVNFVGKGERKAQSHELAKRLRPEIKKIGDRFGARIKVVEIPPGPPVLSTLVAEVYGPELERRIEIAQQIKEVFTKTEGVVDIDWYVEADQPKVTFAVDRDKAAINGLSTDHLAREMRIALNGMNAGLLHLEKEKEPVELTLRLPLQDRSDIVSLKQIAIPTPAGRLVSLSELITVNPGMEDKTIYHNNLKNVTYVIADVAGREESPVYAILKMRDAIAALKLPEGYSLQQHYSTQPPLEHRYSMKWNGEWQITYEVFRDLGIAFAAVLVLIYVMVVGWFRSFLVPLVIIAPIPLSLVGILPAHALMGAFFTATSMIGFIAGAGIVVRNSIILVDFIELQLSQGVPLKEAIVQAGIIRFRPMLLTAAAVVVGSSVILFDPIFQGMAISLMAGEVASTLLSRTMVPVLYYEYKVWTGRGGSSTNTDALQ
jgi:multidrug efflux pump subunit AcrB